MTLFVWSLRRTIRRKLGLKKRLISRLTKKNYKKTGAIKNTEIPK